MKTPAEIVAQVVLENYGPEGDPELYAAAQAEARPADPGTTVLLDYAAWMRDLNGDGVRALMRAAVEADRAQRRPTLVVLARGETLTNDAEAEVLDVEYILQTGAAEYAREEIDKIAAQLREHGWDSIAEDVQEAWEDAQA